MSDDFYVSVGTFYNQRYKRTPVSDMFLSPTNLKFLQHALQQMMFELFSKKFAVAMDHPYIELLYKTAGMNPGMAYFGMDGLKALNRHFLVEQCRILYFSYREDQLFEEFFIEDDREKVLPYGIPEKVTKGQIVYDPSSYFLQSPSTQYHNDYMKTVFGISQTNCQ